MLQGNEWVRIQPAPEQPALKPEPEAPADDVLHPEAIDPGQVGGNV
jgi:hypothetical protein